MKRFFKVVSLTAILTFVKMIFGIIISKVIAIHAGPSGMALFGQMQGFTTIMTNLGNSPCNSGVIKYTSEYEEKGIEFYSHWWKASLFWLVTIYLPLLILTALFSKEISSFLTKQNEYSWMVIISAIFIPLTSLGVLCTSIYNSLRDYKNLFLSGIISICISSLIIIYAIIHYKLLGAILAALLQPAIIGITIIFYSIKEKWFRFKYFFGPVNYSAKRDILKYVIMIAVSAIAGPLSIIMLRLFLVENVGWKIAGEWQSVWKISEVYLGVITLALSTYYLPVLAKTKSYEQLKFELAQTIKLVLPLVILSAAVVYVLRDFIILILFTSEFKGARELFLIQLIGDVIKILSYVYAYPMLAKGKIRFFIFTELLFGVTLVALAFSLIKFSGVHGANIAYALNYFLYFIFIICTFRRLYGNREESPVS